MRLMSFLFFSLTFFSFVVSSENKLTGMTLHAGSLGSSIDFNFSKDISYNIIPERFSEPGKAKLTLMIPRADVERSVLQAVAHFNAHAPEKIFFTIKRMRQSVGLLLECMYDASEVVVSVVRADSLHGKIALTFRLLRKQSVDRIKETHAAVLEYA